MININHYYKDITYTLLTVIPGAIN